MAIYLLQTGLFVVVVVVKLPSRISFSQMEFLLTTGEDFFTVDGTSLLWVEIFFF